MAWSTSLLALLETYGMTSSAQPDDEGAVVTATVTASGESASVEASLSASVEDQTAYTNVVATAEAETEGTTIFATGEAAASGETASVSVDVAADAGTLEPDIAGNGSATAEAEAEAPEDGNASATASTDVEATGPDLEVSEDRETVETGGDNPTATSTTQFTAVRTEGAPFEDLRLAVEGAALDMWWHNVDWDLSAHELWS
jgi:hypothetical protein